MQENVRNVASSINTSSNAKLELLVATFNKGETLLEGEVMASEKRVEKNIHELATEIEKVRFRPFPRLLRSHPSS
jgi:hypothetical protein